MVQYSLQKFFVFLEQPLPKQNRPATAGRLFEYVGAALSSQEAALQVFSARMSLTAVFGMGTGGPSSPLAPTMEKTACTASFVFTGDPYGIRTHVAGVRGQSLRPLDQRAVLVHHQGFEPWTP